MINQNLKFSQISLLTGVKRHTLNARFRSTFNNMPINRTQGNQILLSPDQTKILIEDVLVSEKGRVIYVGNLKGGVGKTTIAYLLTDTISKLGIKVCAIDLDVQANFTRQYLNINVEQPVFYDIIDNKTNVKNTIIEVTPTLSFIPSSLKNSLIQKALSIQAPKHHLTWFNSLCLDYLREKYDLIIVDTPPHLSTLNSVFCLCLNDNDNIVIPICAEDFSIMGVQMFLEDVLSIRESYQIKSNPKISILMNRFFQNQKTNLEMFVKIGQEYGELLSDTIIKDNAKIREIVNNKIGINEIKSPKEVYEILSNLLQEFSIIKRNKNGS